MGGERRPEVAMAPRPSSARGTVIARALAVSFRQVVHPERLQNFRCPRSDRLNIHKNARLTPIGRARLVPEVASGQTPQAIARAAGVGPRTVRNG